MGIGIVLDLILLFAFVGGILWCMRRGFVRTLVATLLLFLATIVAALLYSPLIGLFSTSLGNPSSGRTAGAIVFGALVIVLYAVLEFTISRNYPDLRIARLGTWDNILGALVGIVWSALAISLFLLVLDFGAITIGSDITFVSDLLRTSFMVPLFRKFFLIPLAPIRLLFPHGLPEVLTYFTR